MPRVRSVSEELVKNAIWDRIQAAKRLVSPQCPIFFEMVAQCTIRDMEKRERMPSPMRNGGVKSSIRVGRTMPPRRVNS